MQFLVGRVDVGNSHRLMIANEVMWLNETNFHLTETNSLFFVTF